MQWENLENSISAQHNSNRVVIASIVVVVVIVAIVVAFNFLHIYIIIIFMISRMNINCGAGWIVSIGRPMVGHWPHYQYQLFSTHYFCKIYEMFEWMIVLLCPQIKCDSGVFTSLSIALI